MRGFVCLQTATRAVASDGNNIVARSEYKGFFYAGFLYQSIRAISRSPKIADKLDVARMQIKRTDLSILLIEHIEWKIIPSYLPDYVT